MQNQKMKLENNSTYSTTKKKKTLKNLTEYKTCTLKTITHS